MAVFMERRKETLPGVGEKGWLTAMLARGASIGSAGEKNAGQ